MAQLQTKQSNNGVGKKIALGATGVALAAGAVVAGVALSDKKNRTKIKKGVKVAAKRIRKIGHVIDEGRERVQAIQHRIRLAYPGGKNLTKRGRKILKNLKEAKD